MPPPVNDKTKPKGQSRVAIALKNKKLKVQTNFNQVVPLVDGPEIFGRMGEMFKKAKKYIYITAWNLRMKTPIQRKKLGDWIIKKAKEGVKVRILWTDLDAKMSPFNERKAISKILKRDKTGNLVIVLSELKDLSTNMANIIQSLHGGTIGSHHQKTVVVDGLYAICSGADLTTGAVNRTYWHDTSVYIQGEGVKGIEENFVKRWNDEAPKDGISETLTLNPKAKSSKICKTILSIPSWSWRDTDIRTEYLSLINNATKTIYLENQYIRHPEVGEALVKAAKKNIQIDILIPVSTEEIKPGKKNLKIEHKIMHYSQYKIIKAIATGDLKWLTDTADMLKKKIKSKNLKNVRIISTRTKNKPYCHSKMMIVDNKKSIVGSANLNPRSLDAVVDSEINVVIDDEMFARTLYAKSMKSKKRYKTRTHDIDGDEVITRFNKFNFKERDDHVKKFGNYSFMLGSMKTEMDANTLRELYIEEFDFLL